MMQASQLYPSLFRCLQLFDSDSCGCVQAKEEGVGDVARSIITRGVEKSGGGSKDASTAACAGGVIAFGR